VVEVEDALSHTLKEVSVQFQMCRGGNSFNPIVVIVCSLGKQYSSSLVAAK
jgi:hypothetical protein